MAVKKTQRQKLPRTLFVARSKSDDIYNSEYFMAERSSKIFSDGTRVGVYKLVDVTRKEVQHRLVPATTKEKK